MSAAWGPLRAFSPPRSLLWQLDRTAIRRLLDDGLRRCLKIVRLVNRCPCHFVHLLLGDSSCALERLDDHCAREAWADSPDKFQTTFHGTLNTVAMTEWPASWRKTPGQGSCCAKVNSCITTS
jgi:hypothetical protein